VRKIVANRVCARWPSKSIYVSLGALDAGPGWKVHSIRGLRPSGDSVSAELISRDKPEAAVPDGKAARSREDTSQTSGARDFPRLVFQTRYGGICCGYKITYKFICPVSACVNFPTFQVDHHETTQGSMKKEQVDAVPLVTNAQPPLPSDESEVAAEFEENFLEAKNQSFFESGLGIFVFQSQELQDQAEVSIPQTVSAELISADKTPAWIGSFVERSPGQTWPLGRRRDGPAESVHIWHVSCRAVPAPRCGGRFPNKLRS
jgi:hypothetical protein